LLEKMTARAVLANYGQQGHRVEYTVAKVCRILQGERGTNLTMLRRSYLGHGMCKEVDAGTEKRKAACILQLSVYRSSPLFKKDFLGRR
jgi:hypothetical protein